MMNKTNNKTNKDKKYNIKNLKDYILWKQKSMTEAEYWRKKYYGEI